MRHPSPAIGRAIESLQTIVQRDEGGRGIRPLTRPGQLLTMAMELLSLVRPPQRAGIVVLTGFPCMRERTPPGETDGPPGAAAVARSLAALGARVSMPIEFHSEAVLRQCLEAQCSPDASLRPQPEVIGFPTADQWTAEAGARLEALRSVSSGLVCLERAGEAADGVCYTMRGLPMGSSLVAGELNALAKAEAGLRCVAIGDGGNELGLGSLHADICEHVPRGSTIGCVVPAHSVLVASVSNWGGYALSHALSLLAWEDGWRSGDLGDGEGAPPWLSASLPAEAFLSRIAPDACAAEKVIRAANDAGAVDGITAEGGGAVDGMPIEAQRRIVDELRAATIACMCSLPRGGSSEG